MLAISHLSILLTILTLFPIVFGTTCDFSNDLVSMSWKVANNIVTIKYKHTNLKDGRWTAIAFGNGPGMTNLEAIIFKRKGNNVLVRTGYTPKYGKVKYDPESYVAINSISIIDNLLEVLVSRPLGPAGPRDFSLDRCINWSIVPGGGLNNNDELKKHHGGAFKIKNVCAAECSSRRFMMLSNRIN